MKHLENFILYTESYKLLNNYSLDKDQEYKYMLTVRNILRSKYPTYKETLNDGSSLERLLDDKLNWISGNRKLRYKIIKDYNIKTFDELLKVIEENKEQIFVKDIDKYLSILDITKSSGEKSEMMAISKIHELLGGNNGDFIISRPDNEQIDYMEGVDIIIKSKKDFEFMVTCQVKPGKKSEIIGEYFKIESSGGIKEYETDLICFTSQNGIALFLLDEYKIDEKYFYIKRSDYIKTLEKFKEKLKVHL